MAESTGAPSGILLQLQLRPSADSSCVQGDFWAELVEIQVDIFQFFFSNMRYIL